MTEETPEQQENIAASATAAPDGEASVQTAVDLDTAQHEVVHVDFHSHAQYDIVFQRLFSINIFCT